MDDTSVQLLADKIASQVQLLRDARPDPAAPRGGTLAILLDILIDGAEAEAADLCMRLRTATGGARNALGRKLVRSDQRLQVAHLIAADYAGDVGRQDISVGLLCLVDALVVDLLPETADPLIHLNKQRMYSTLSLNLYAGTLIRDAGLASALGVIVLNLPALDPANALLAPILVHEVGHTAVSHSGLLGRLTGRLDTAALDAALAKHAALNPGADTTEWKELLSAWVHELLCDALAAALTGPSFLFASAAFLPAPNPGSLGKHPFPFLRIDQSLRQLDKLGWTNHLADQAPTIRAWLETLVAAGPAAEPGADAFLREALDLMADSLWDTALEHVREPLEPTGYARVSDDLAIHVRDGIPPSRLTAQIPTPWHMILAGWEAAIATHGDTGETLATAVSDAAFNEFLVKCIEITRITDIWDEL